MKDNKNVEMMEKNLVTLIEDEEKYYGGATPATPAIMASIGIASLLGITSNCTSQCWHPGK